MSRVIWSLALLFCAGLAAASEQEGDSAQPKDRDIAARKRIVLRLNNAPAMDVAGTINKLLAAEQASHQVTVLPEVVTNSLIISAAPQAIAEIKELVEQLDLRPQTVRIEVLIAEVLCDAAESSEDGPAVSASNDDVEARVRAIENSPGLKTLIRLLVTTLNNQPAFIQIGESVPMIRIVSSTNGDHVSSVTHENVGLILGVTPRISSDGQVTMEVDVENSRLEPIDQGVPVLVSDGELIRSPRKAVTSIQTTVSVADGQSVILGGLITQSKTERTELLIVLTPHLVDK